MGRFDIKTSIEHQQPVSQGTMPDTGWPTKFPKELIGIERTGVIIGDSKPIMTPDNIVVLPGALEAIRMIRIKGYKVMIFFNEPLISQGILTQQAVDITNQKLMEIFGIAGIFSIDGLLYSTTNLKQDIYSMPNNGMMKKAETDHRVSFKGGYFVGDKLYNLKAGASVGAKPILVRTGKFEETLKTLDTFANRDLKEKTKVYFNLLEFANSLP